jgi:phage shock protein C
MLMDRRVYRCRHDRKLAGVAAGMAEYFDLDPTLIRVLWVASVLLGGFSILVYLLLAFIVPLEPVGPGEEDTHLLPASGHRHARRGDGRLATIIGVALILFGTVALLDVLLPAWVDAGRYVWPVVLVGVGVVLVAGALRRAPAEEREPTDL